MKRAIAFLLPLLLFGSGALAQAAKPTQMVAMNSCVTSDCHASVKQYKVLHGPVNVNACDACHKVVDPAQHTFELQRDRTATCTFCHQISTANMTVVHKPVTQGDCLGCHDPHGGATAKFTRGATLKDLCSRCHQDVVANRKMIHGPVAAGACGACHAGHASNNPKLLISQGRELCLSCHTEMKNQMATVKFQHKAVEQECTVCHDAHASDYPKQIKQAPLALCTSCHEPIKVAAMDATYKHTIVTSGDACLNCHTAHGGDLAKLLRAEPIKVCMKCHNQPIKVNKDVTIAAVSEVLDPNTIKHGPIRDGNCSGCHNVHGSNVQNLLIKSYPDAFYQGFSQDKYQLCFTCHDPQLVLLPKTEGLTGFRNGTMNLHYLHVNKSDRGRNCRACHDTHASTHELHVRDSVPYGNWQMPLNFTKLDTGGSCAPGCHQKYEYNRVNPVLYSVPTTLPASKGNSP